MNHTDSAQLHVKLVCKAVGLLIVLGFLSGPSCIVSQNPLDPSSDSSTIEDNHQPGLTTPVAVDASFQVAKDSSYSGQLIASDSKGAKLTYVVGTQPSHGTVTISDQHSPAFIYVPSAGYSGSDAFTFTVANGAFTSLVATVSITVVQTFILSLLNPTTAVSHKTIPTFNVAGVVSGSTVTLYSDSSCSTQVASGTATDTSVNLTVSSALSPGAYSFYAKESNGTATSSCSSATLAYRVDTSASALSITPSYRRVAEGAGAQSFTVSLSTAKAYDVTVYYNTVGSTATSSLSSLVSGTVVIPAGQTSATVNFNVGSDGVATGERVVQFNIEGADSSMVYVDSIFYQSRLYISDAEYSSVNVSKLSVGSAFACAILGNGTLKCWGANSSGQLGQNYTTASYTPVTVDSGVSYSRVATGNTHGCGITTGGVLKCWGANLTGQVGANTATSPLLTPQVIDSGTNYIWISTGVSHSCGITSAKVLKCWGSSGNGRLGDGNTSGNQIAPVVIDAGVSYIQVSAGASHTCGIVDVTGVLKCWGSQASGRVGDGVTTGNQVTPLVIDTGNAYSFISAGFFSTCGITAGVLKCWGANSSGVTGLGVSSGSQTTPLAVDSGVNYTSVALSGNAISHACGVTSTNVLKCWGTNVYRQLATGNTTTSLVPVVSDSGISYSSIGVGSNFTCGINTSGAMKCWGYNLSGQLGLGFTSSAPSYSATPIVIENNTAYTSIIVTNLGTCGRTAAGVVKCWGYNFNGAIGDGYSTNTRYSQIQFDPATVYTSFSNGPGHSCGIVTGGILKCWGANSSGQLGLGDTTSRYYPTDVVDMGVSYAAVYSLGSYTCGLTTTGVLKCWGHNYDGSVGDGTTTNQSLPVVIDSGTSYSKVATGGGGGNHNCAITTAGVLKCWGYNFSGQIGDGTTTTSLVPLVIDAGVTYQSVTLGAHHTCGITTGGVLKCWGNNSTGQVGDNTGNNSNLPVVIDLGTSYSFVRAFSGSTCGITVSGVLKCWGANGFSQLGDGMSDDVLAPVVIDSGVSYNYVTFSDYYGCGITTGGSLKCWGTSSRGFGEGINLELPMLQVLSLDAP